MPNIQLKIYSRIVGASPQQPPLDPVLVELLEQEITVAELIQRVVEEQIRHLTHKRQLNSTEVQLALARQYLSAEEVQAQAEGGRVRLPSASPKLTQPIAIDSKAEIRKAVDAFKTAQYFVIINGETAKSLNQSFSFDLNTKILFVRVTPLIGG